MSLYLKEMRKAGIQTLISNPYADKLTYFKISLNTLTDYFLFEDFEESIKFLEYFGIYTDDFTSSPNSAFPLIKEYEADLNKDVFKKCNHRFIEIKKVNENLRRRDLVNGAISEPDSSVNDICFVNQPQSAMKKVVSISIPVIVSDNINQSKNQDLGSKISKKTAEGNECNDNTERCDDKKPNTNQLFEIQEDLEDDLTSKKNNSSLSQSNNINKMNSFGGNNFDQSEPNLSRNKSSFDKDKDKDKDNDKTIFEQPFSIFSGVSGRLEKDSETIPNHGIIDNENSKKTENQDETGGTEPQSQQKQKQDKDKDLKTYIQPDPEQLNLFKTISAYNPERRKNQNLICSFQKFKTMMMRVIIRKTQRLSSVYIYSSKKNLSIIYSRD